MSLRTTVRNLAALLSIPLIATAAEAVTITTVRVDHVSSELAFNGAFTRTASNTVNGSGFNAVTGTHGNSGANNNAMWLSTTSNSICCGGTEYGGVITAAANPADTAPEITWDLGARHNLASMKVWNYNEVNLTNRGVQSAALRVSNDGITYTNLGNVVLNQAPGNTTVDFSQVINLNTSARFVQLDINSNYGDGNGFVGLSEVRFDGTLTGPRQTLVTGVTATASSQLVTGPFDRAASHVVDGSGFNAVTGTHGNSGEGIFWLSTGNGIAGGTPDAAPQITFDLGKVRTVGEVQIWNYNEISSGGSAQRSRGIENMTVLVSDDGVLFTSLGATTLFAAPGTADRDYHQTLDLGVRARFVRFANLSSHGGDNGFVGLSEVRFFEAIPEPATATLGLLSVAGLMLRRRRMA